jgi:O-antigen/teichoic acid export membrane protein
LSSPELSIPTYSRSLIRRVAGYGATKGTTEGLYAVRSLLLAVFLGPLSFGSWALLRLGLQYATLGRIGILRGLERELLHPSTHRSTSRTESPASTTLGFILLVAVAVAATSVGLARITTNSDHRVILYGLAAAVFADSIYGYALVCIRCRSGLRRYAIIETGTALLHVVLGAGFAWVWGLAGACAGLTIASLIGIAAGLQWSDLRPALSPEQLRRLFQVGLPLTLTTGAGILLVTTDRWIVAGWGGTTMLGYYAIAASLTTAATGLAVVIRTVVFRNVYGQTSSAGVAAALKAHLDQSVLPFALLLPPMLGAAGIALGPVVAFGLPQYIPAIAPGRIFLLMGTAMGVVSLATLGAIAAGHQRRLPMYAGLSLVLTACLSILALSSGLGLNGVALSALAGHMFFAGALLRVLFREAGVAGAGRFAALALLPLAWCAAAVTVLGWLLPGLDPQSAALGLAAYLLLLLPLIPLRRLTFRLSRS